MSADVPRFVILTGLSGAGKSHAIRALEDLGYFCVDNLPLALIPTFADLTAGSHREIRRAAVVVDIRGGKELSGFPAVYRRLKRRRDLRVALIFLEADERVLLRRFSETRRPHPLAPGRSAAEGLHEERRQLRADSRAGRSDRRHEPAQRPRVAARDPRPGARGRRPRRRSRSTS